MPQPNINVPPAPTGDSAESLARAREGDAGAFCELCREVETRLVRQAYTLCGHHATAEDLAQETLMAAWKNISRFRGQCRFFTWICGILINLHRNARRKQALLQRVSFASSVGLEPGAPHEPAGEADPLPDHSLLLDERQRLLLACLDRLPPRHRDVVYLRFYVDESLEGIAAALNCSLGTVKSRLFHGLEKLSLMQDIQQLKNLP